MGVFFILLSVITILPPTPILYLVLTLGKITGGESVRVTGCVCHDETSDKFRFSVTGADISSGGTGGDMVTYNIQVRIYY